MKHKNILGFSLVFLILISWPLSFATGEAAKKAGGNIMAELKLFSKAMNVIREAYVNDVNVRDMLYSAVKGMLQDLDKHSEFIDPKRYELLKIHMRGEYAGIGALLKVDGLFPAIRGVKPGSAAHKVGLLINDRIIKIDGESTEGWELTKVASSLRGEAGEALILTIERPPVPEVFDVEIKREKIEIQSVRDVRMVGKHVGYFWIQSWQDRTIDQVDEAVSKLIKDGMKALIIDVRHNDGGLLPAAVALSERFLGKGQKIVSVKSKVKEQRKEYESSGDFFIKKDIKLVILVNEKSASASEIFSVAMQDHNRGTVVGVQTYGKASVQSVIPLDDKSAMKLTTAGYISPSGRAIDSVGLEPNHVVSMDAGGPDRQILKALELLKDEM